MAFANYFVQGAQAGAQLGLNYNADQRAAELQKQQMDLAQKQEARAQQEFDFRMGEAKRVQDRAIAVDDANSYVGLIDAYGGDIAKASQSPEYGVLLAQQIGRDPAFAERIAGNDGYKPSAFVRGSDGNYTLVMQNQNGEYRTLSDNRNNGGANTKFTQAQLNGLMASRLARVGVTDPSVMMALDAQVQAGTGRPAQQVYAELAPQALTPENIPQASNLGAVRQAKTDISNKAPLGNGKPAQVVVSADQAKPQAAPPAQTPAQPAPQTSSSTQDAVNNAVWYRDGSRGVYSNVTNDTGAVYQLPDGTVTDGATKFELVDVPNGAYKSLGKKAYASVQPDGSVSVIPQTNLVTDPKLVAAAAQMYAANNPQQPALAKQPAAPQSAPQQMAVPTLLDRNTKPAAQPQYTTTMPEGFPFIPAQLDVPTLLDRNTKPAAQPQYTTTTPEGFPFAPAQQITQQDIDNRDKVIAQMQATNDPEKQAQLRAQLEVMPAPPVGSTLEDVVKSLKGTGDKIVGGISDVGNRIADTYMAAKDAMSTGHPSDSLTPEVRAKRDELIAQLQGETDPSKRTDLAAQIADINKPQTTKTLAAAVSDVFHGTTSDETARAAAATTMATSAPDGTARTERPLYDKRVPAAMLKDPNAAAELVTNMRQQQQTFTPQQHVATGMGAVSMLNPSGGQLSSKARYAVMRLHAMGVYTDSMTANMLQSGRYTYDDVHAAAAMMSAQASMMNARTAAQNNLRQMQLEAMKIQAQYGKDQADLYVKQQKDAYTRVDNAVKNVSVNLAPAIMKNSAMSGPMGLFNSKDQKVNFDGATKMSESLLYSMASDPDVIRLVSRGARDNYTDLTAEDLNRMSGLATAFLSDDKAMQFAKKAGFFDFFGSDTEQTQMATAGAIKLWYSDEKNAKLVGRVLNGPQFSAAKKGGNWEQNQAAYDEQADQ